MSISISKVLTVHSGNPVGQGGLVSQLAGPGLGVGAGLSSPLPAVSGGLIAGSVGGSLGGGGSAAATAELPLGLPMAGSMGCSVGGSPVVHGAGVHGGPENPQDKTEFSGEEALVKVARLGGKMAGGVIKGLMSAFLGGGGPGPT